MVYVMFQVFHYIIGDTFFFVFKLKFEISFLPPFPLPASSIPGGVNYAEDVMEAIAQLKIKCIKPGTPCYWVLYNCLNNYPAHMRKG